MNSRDSQYNDLESALLGEFLSNLTLKECYHPETGAILISKKHHKLCEKIWEGRYQDHFPDEYKNLISSNEKVNWGKAYHEMEKDLDFSIIKRLFFLLREGKIDQFKHVFEKAMAFDKKNTAEFLVNHTPPRRQNFELKSQWKYYYFFKFMSSMDNNHKQALEYVTDETARMEIYQFLKEKLDAIVSENSQEAGITEFYAFKLAELALECGQGETCITAGEQIALINNMQDPVDKAAQYGCVHVLKMLSATGNHVMDPPAPHNTPLMTAVSYRHFSATAYLVEEEKANIHRRNQNRKRPLDIAIDDSETQMVRFLLKNGAAVTEDQIEQKFRSALKEEYEYSQDSTIANLAVLFESHSDLANLINTPIDGKTPLMIAAEAGNDRMVRFLLRQPGIDIYARDASNENVLDYALNTSTVDWKIFDKVIQTNIFSSAKRNSAFGSLGSYINRKCCVIEALTKAGLLLPTRHFLSSGIFRDMLDQKTALQLDLVHLIEERSKDERESQAWVSFWSSDYTRTDKLAAQQALLAVIQGKQPVSTLVGMHDILNNGRTGKIYRQAIDEETREAISRGDLDHIPNSLLFRAA